MKIGMEFRDGLLSGKDFRRIEQGNPGCGGTQFEFSLLAHHLLKLDKGYEVVFFHLSDNIFEKGIKAVKVKTINEIPEAANREKVDILLFWSTHDDEWYKEIESNNVLAVAWAHNFLSRNEIVRIKNCKNIVKTVCVSKEQYQLLYGEDIYEKCTYINNMYDFENDDKNALKKEPLLCCVGTLIKAKGFHIIAKLWPKILKSVPDAQLYVLGNAQLWNSKTVMGKYSLAEARYEKRFIKYLIDQNGEILPSVHFLGNLGIEKREVYKKCKVGVVNPTGVETFCLSAIEMEAEGIPVCSKKTNGLKNTIIHQKTGLLSRTKTGLKRNIVELLTDDELNTKYGKQASEFARSFGGEIIVEEWDTLFEDVFNHKVQSYRENEKYVFDEPRKVVRFLIGKLRRKYHLRFVPEPSLISLWSDKLKGVLVYIRGLILHR